MSSLVTGTCDRRNQLLLKLYDTSLLSTYFFNTILVRNCKQQLALKDQKNNVQSKISQDLPSSISCTTVNGELSLPGLIPFRVRMKVSHKWHKKQMALLHAYWYTDPLHLGASPHDFRLSKNVRTDWSKFPKYWIIFFSVFYRYKQPLNQLNRHRANAHKVDTVKEVINSLCLCCKAHP